MDIPKDVITAASQLVQEMPKRAPFQSDVAKAIARGMMIERKRCAAVVGARFFEVVERRNVPIPRDLVLQWLELDRAKIKEPS